MARRNIWEQIWESTEGPTVTLNLPRSVAEELLGMIASALEVEDMEGGDDVGMDGLDGINPDLDDPAGGDDEFGMGMDDGGELDFGAGDDVPAGDDDDDEPPPPPKKKSPPKKDGGEKKKDDKPKDDDKDKKEALGESVRRLGAYVPRTRR